jgi:hypothetical protein
LERWRRQGRHRRLHQARHAEERIRLRAGIRQLIGRRPVVCVGNSDGDQSMLEYTTIGNPRPSLGMIIHHTDADREFAYDAHPPASGTLVTALAAAGSRGWTMADMKNDWTRVFKN